MPDLKKNKKNKETYYNTISLQVFHILANLYEYVWSQLFIFMQRANASVDFVQFHSNAFVQSAHVPLWLKIVA